MRPVTLLAVGSIKKPFWHEAAEHYRRCLRPRLRLTHLALPDGRGTPKHAREAEASRILSALKPRHRLIALHETGEGRTSVQLAALLEELWDHGAEPCFVIGGPFGLAPLVLQKAWLQLSLGPLTLPHELVQVILLEQLYRAATLLAGTPYHY